MDKANSRKDLFLHLEGLSIGALICCMEKNNVFNYLLNQSEPTSITKLSEKLNASPGYLNIALHLLSGINWMDKSKKNEVPHYQIHNKKHNLSELFREPVKYIKKFKNLEDAIDRECYQSTKGLSNIFSQDIDKIINNISSVSSQVSECTIKQIEGIIVSPIMVFLGFSNLSKEIKKNNWDINFISKKNIELHSTIISIFNHMNWIDKNIINDKGKFYIERAGAYGVTFSYLPTLLKLDDIIFNKQNFIWERNTDNSEKHVMRTINVWGSGQAHKAYFKKIDEVITDIFNGPIEKQPKGIADMGCGDGAMLIHVYNLIKEKTIRGTNLKEYPLSIVGIDYNEKALTESENNFKNENIEAITILGNINDPKSLKENLKSKYRIDATDLLHIRSFLDHNRIYTNLNSYEKIKFKNPTDGCYAFKGSTVISNDIQADLVSHFKNWKPLISKHGLLVIELHGLPTDLNVNNRGLTPSIAYECTHGFSDQYIVEVRTFFEASKIAELKNHLKYFKKFPNNELATITINYFK